MTHPYTLESAARRAVLILTSMSGYDEFMAGAFWFFRGLLVASIAFLLLYKLIDSRTRLRPELCVALICLGMVGFTWLHIAVGFKLSIPNGGWRETWGIFFFGIGVLFRSYEPRLIRKWWLTILLTAFLVFAATQHFSGMNNGGKLRDLITLPLTGTAGFLVIHHLSSLIDSRDTRLRRLLIFIGDNTLYVFILHIICFKPVSILKIIVEDLDPAMVGCHMVIHENHTDIFWVIYSIAGVALPLLLLQGYRIAKAALSARNWVSSRR